MRNIFAGGVLLIAALFAAACSEDTGSLGLYEESDVILSAIENFTVTTRSLPLDSVVASSTKSYLGHVYDPETDIDVRADFLAQFYTFEEYEFEDTTMISSREGKSIVCDSIVLRLYFSDYYGDASAPMKVAVWELDTANVIREDSVYSSQTKLDSYKNPKRTEPLVEKMFTAADYTLSTDELYSDSHYDNVHIVLPREYGTWFLRMITKHPEFMKDSYQFIHHLFPGFYFQLKSGTGAMLAIDVCTLDLYFRYKYTDGYDYMALARFSATPEVIQSTRIQTRGIAAKAPVDAAGEPLAPANDTTYVMAPSGIATEITLPVDEVYQNHEGDSISRARVILNCYNAKTSSVFEAPSTLLMVRKDARYSFFKEDMLPDDVTSYLASYASDNTYTFSNIGRLLSALYHEKQQKMQAEGLTSEEYNAAYPNWNRVVVTPVVVTTNTSGYTVSVEPEFSLSRAALIGGQTPLNMQVIYGIQKK